MHSPVGTLLERLIWRVALAVGLLAGLSMFGFGLLALLPSDYAEVILISRMAGEVPSPEALAAFRAQQGFDDPMPVQYLRWLGATLTGDLGVSFTTGDPVAEEIGLRLAATAQLVGVAFLMMLGLGVPIGILAALHRGGPIDRIVTAIAVLGMSVPNFWQALLFVLLFALVLGWAPSSGYGEWRHVVLPAAVIATASMGLTARYVRASLVSAFAEPHLRTALAKGRSRVGALLVHALPTALPGILTVLGLQLARMFDGAIVVETIFAWPGLGRMLVEALLDRDFPVLQAALLVVGAAYVTINLAVDLAVAAIDPRMGEAV